MIQVALGSTIWDAGVHYYVLSYEFNSVTPEDFYLVLQAAADENSPTGEALNVTEIFQSWEHQAGILLPVKTYLLRNDLNSNLYRISTYNCFEKR